MGDVETKHGSTTRGEPEVDLLVLFLLTSAWLIVSQGILSQNMPMTVAALKLCATVLLLTGAVALLWCHVRCLELAVLAVAACLAAVLWLRNDWLLVPLGMASAAFAYSAGLRRILAPFFRFELWVGSLIATALILSATAYGDFLIMEKLPWGDVPQDTLFHASVASMIKTYGVVSSGVHGLTGVEGHALSHHLIAALSTLSGVPVLETYGIIQNTIACPLLIVAATWCAYRVSDRRSASVARSWVIVCAVLMLMSLLPLETWAVYDDAPFNSESYTLSVFLLLMALPVLASSCSTTGATTLAGALIVLAGFAKGSTGVVGLCLLWGRAMVMPGSPGRRTYVTIALLATAAWWYVMSMATANVSSSSHFAPLSYLETWSVFGGDLAETLAALRLGRVPAMDTSMLAFISVTSFLLVMFFLPWVVVVRRWVVSGARATLAHEDSLLSLAAVAVGVVMLSVDLVNYNVFYFLHPATFVALPFVVAIVCRRLDGLPPAVPRSLAVIVALGVGFLLVRGYQEHVGVFLKGRGRMRQHEAYGPMPVNQNVAALLSLRDRERHHPVVFEPDASFPRPAPGFLYCAARPFLYPAVTERAWVGVIEVDGKCPFANYGYPAIFQGHTQIVLPPVIPPSVVVVRVSGGKSALK